MRRHLPERLRHHWLPQAQEEAVRESLLGVAGESCPPGPSVHFGPQWPRKVCCHQAGKDSVWALGPPPAELLLRGIKNWSQDRDHARRVEGCHGQARCRPESLGWLSHSRVHGLCICRCSFDVFVGRKVISTSYFSIILKCWKFLKSHFQFQYL